MSAGHRRRAGRIGRPGYRCTRRNAMTVMKPAQGWIQDCFRHAAPGTSVALTSTITLTSATFVPIPSGKLPHQAGLRFYLGHVRIPIPNGRSPTEKDSTISLVPTSTTFTTPD